MSTTIFIKVNIFNLILNKARKINGYRTSQEIERFVFPLFLFLFMRFLGTLFSSEEKKSCTAEVSFFRKMPQCFLLFHFPPLPSFKKRHSVSSHFFRIDRKKIIPFFLKNNTVSFKMRPATCQ